MARCSIGTFYLAAAFDSYHLRCFCLVILLKSEFSYDFLCSALTITQTQEASDLTHRQSRGGESNRASEKLEGPRGKEIKTDASAEETSNRKEQTMRTTCNKCRHRPIIRISTYQHTLSVFNLSIVKRRRPDDKLKSYFQ